MKYQFQVTCNKKVIQSGTIEADSPDAAYYRFMAACGRKIGLVDKAEHEARINSEIPPDLPPGFEELFKGFGKKDHGFRTPKM